MKLNFNGILIVEGKEDKSFLSSFINCPIFTVNGLEVDKYELTFLKKISDFYPIYILTDPDKAGEEIKERILASLPEAKPIIINKKFCTRGYKKGVAECEKNEIIRVLSFKIEEKSIFLNNISLSDLIKLSNDQLDKVIVKYGLNHSNKKQIVKRLNLLKLDITQLLKV